MYLFHISLFKIKLSKMSAVYLFPLESVKPLGEHFISMENMARVKNSSLEAVVEMATDLDLWKIVKQDVT